MYIAIDVGGTNIRVTGVYDLKSPKIVNVIRKKTENDYDRAMEKIAEAINKITDKPTAIALALKGSIDPDKTKSISKKGLPGWNQRPLKFDLEQKFSCPAYLDNDSALACLGDHVYGNQKDDFLFIIWGTGTGGSIFKNNEFTNIEAGHNTVLVGGNLESYTGSHAIKNRYGKAPDFLSKEEWQDVINHFTKGLKIILEKYPTKNIIFGGGIALNHPDKVMAIKENLNKKLTSPVTVEITNLGDNAGLYGALALIDINLQKKSK